MGYALFSVQLHNAPDDVDRLTADLKQLLLAQSWSDSDVDVEVVEHTQSMKCEECARGNSPHNQTRD